MVDWRTWWAAAVGEAPSGELVAARRGLTRRQVRAARRAVRRGQEVQAPGGARLAVAQARQVIRRRPPAWAVVVLAVFVVVAFGVFVAEAVRGHVATYAGIGGAVALVGVWLLARLPRLRRNALRAERLNRELLERAGRPYREDPGAVEPVRLSAPALTVGVVAVWASYDLTYGTLMLVGEGRPLTVGHVVGRGVVFATFMVAFNLTWVRRRNERRSHDPLN